jgi:hypothetical protein
VDYKYLRRLADSGQLTARRTVGGHRRFTARSIAQYLAGGRAS